MNVSWNHYWRPACAAFPMCRRWSQTARVNRRTHPLRADACGSVPGKSRSRKRFGGPRQVGTEIVEGATVVFEIQDMPEPALRALVAPMCLVQALAIGLDLAAD